ncbi:hypothetical protein TSUD_373850 [Trifolium subterraneum]|uniref:Reverse transcriptase zinc-binding domain-containing protein n=1 Tax=Trifolium subterraneum TaxID=3900 RepID=A0A2Z6N8L4_TRISU|nr:hypothetical protein TSUD_373850 [Trifolium subterraneum]
MSSLSWCIIGDFTDLLSQVDKRGNLPHPNWLCMGFRQAISDCDLSDISLEGYPFTWIKSRGTHHVIEERLDRAMTSTSWLNLFPNVRLSNLLASHSDHSPILLHCTPSSRSRFNGSFRFENSWLREPDLEEVVLDGWGVHENIEVVDRVARCGNRLQSWGRKKKVKFKEEIDECVREMEVLRGNQGEEEGRRYQEIHDRHDVLMVQEEDYWKQWAKMHWLKEGGIEVHTQEELCEVAKQYFDTQFKPKNGEQEPVLNLIQRRVTEEDNIYLAAPITKDEIQQALFQMHPDKSPGPMDLIQHSIRGSRSNVVIIFLWQHLPGWIEDLRPISLCNVLYKKAIFSYIKDRIWKKMNSWRGRALSKAGKEVMIKYVLQAIPSYVMSMFILPSSLIDDIEKMLNAFWWGGGSNNNKGIH